MHIPLSSHVIVAAATVASWFPTPTPLSEAWVASVPDRELENALENKRQCYDASVCEYILYKHLCQVASSE